MDDCDYIMPDEYQCTEAGTVKVGDKCYCQDHASEVELENLEYTYPIVD